MKAQNYFMAIVLHFGLAIGAALFVVPFVRTLLKGRVTQPGDGPTKEEARNDRVEYRGVGEPDVPGGGGKGRAFCRVSFEGSLYQCKCF
jgi:hypothetical protein